MPERTAIIASTVGLHARPAAIFARAVAEQSMPVTIRKGDEDPVDASSSLMLMTLGAECGDEVVIQADGDGAEATLDQLVALLETNLDSDDS